MPKGEDDGPAESPAFFHEDAMLTAFAGTVCHGEPLGAAGTSPHVAVHESTSLPCCIGPRLRSLWESLAPRLFESAVLVRGALLMGVAVPEACAELPGVRFCSAAMMLRRSAAGVVLPLLLAAC